MLDDPCTTEYTLEESPGFLIDHEELSIDREFSGYLSDSTIGHGLTCPRCESKKTSFSVGDYTGQLDNDWVCHKCRLIFTKELAWLFNQLRENDKEEQELCLTDLY